MCDHGHLFAGAPSLSSLRSLDGTIVDGFVWQKATLQPEPISSQASQFEDDTAFKLASDGELSLELLNTYWSQLPAILSAPLPDTTIEDIIPPSPADSVLGLTPAWPATFRQTQPSPQRTTTTDTSPIQDRCTKAFDGNDREVTTETVLNYAPSVAALAEWRLDQLVTSFGIVIQVEPPQTVKRRDGSGEVVLTSVTLVDSHHCCRSLTLWGKRADWIRHLAPGRLVVVTHLRIRQYKETLIASTTAWSKLLCVPLESSLSCIAHEKLRAQLQALRPRARTYALTVTPPRSRSTNARPLSSLSKLFEVEHTGLYQVECQFSLSPVEAGDVIVGCSRCGQSLEEADRITLCSCGDRAHLLQNLPAPEPVWCIQGAVTFRLYDQDVSLELPFDHSIFMKLGSAITSLPLSMLKTEVASYVSTMFQAPDHKSAYTALISKLQTQYHLINLSGLSPA